MKHNRLFDVIRKGVRLSIALAILFSTSGVLVFTQPVRADIIEVKNTDNSGTGSLRDAINQANSTPGSDLITFDPSTDGIPIVLTGSSGEDGNLNGDLDILGVGNLNIHGNGPDKTIIDGDGGDRVFHICPGGGCSGTVYIDGVTIQNGYVTGSGGGINSYGWLNLSNSILTGNSATLRGGGLYIWSVPASTTIYSTTFTTNTAIDGGGIYTSGLTELNVSDSTIGGEGAGNVVAGNGGGIYNLVSEVMVYGTTISGNSAVNGGGIFNYDNGTLEITNSTVSSNTASLFGGGVYNKTDGDATVDGSTISENTALNGAGIYTLATLVVENGSTVGGAGAGNIASNEGGGIFNQTGATTTVDGSIVSANEASWGGGIFNMDALNVQNGSTIGGDGAGNTATNNGGGIYNFSGVALVDASHVSGNTAVNGGGIYNEATVTIQQASTIGGTGVGNTASTHGGGIYNKIGFTIVGNSTVSANTAASGGGGVYNENGTATFSNSNVLSNSATDGGGIYNLATLNISNGSSVGSPGAGNQAINDGGGIRNGTDGITTIDNSRVSNNTASYGGGIHNEGEIFDPALLTVQNGSTVGGGGGGNEATWWGGGIYCGSGSNALVDNSTISANTATSGGGIYNACNNLTIQNLSTIGGFGEGNEATSWGGGIYNHYGGHTTVTDSRILNNAAIVGGGVFIINDYQYVVSVIGSCIVNNSDISFFNDKDKEQIATGNWWGAETGPNTGKADTVAGNVTYAGFLTEPILGCGYGGFYIHLPLLLR